MTIQREKGMKMTDCIKKLNPFLIKDIYYLKLN